MVVERVYEDDWYVDGRKYHETHNIDGWEHVELIYKGDQNLNVRKRGRPLYLSGSGQVTHSIDKETR